jgi:hypothetical protein
MWESVPGGAEIFLFTSRPSLGFTQSTILLGGGGGGRKWGVKHNTHFRLVLGFVTHGGVPDRAHL